MSNGTTPGEIPIIVQGGNSVDVDVPNKFEKKGPDKEGYKEKHRVEDQDLDYLTIDGTRHDLHERSVVKIFYVPRGGG